MGPDSLACWARRSRGRRLWPAVAGLLGASLASIACVAPAHALLRREPLGLLATGQALSLVGDGHRYAAFQEAGGPITLLDLARGGRRTVDPGAGPCHLGGFGGGWMSISCLGALGSLTRAELVGVRTLTRVAVKGVPGSPEVVHGADQQLGAVGSRWVIVSTCDPDAHGACTLSYVEWRTGRRVPAAPLTGRLAPDLNSPDLAKAPVRRWVRRATPLLYRRAGRRAVRLSRCRPYCTEIRQVAGTLRWTEEGRIRAYLPRAGRALSWTIPQLPGDPGATAQGVADGPKAILFRLASVGVPGLGQRAYEARWSGP